MDSHAGPSLGVKETGKGKGGNGGALKIAALWDYFKGLEAKLAAAAEAGHRWETAVPRLVKTDNGLEWAGMEG